MNSISAGVSESFVNVIYEVAILYPVLHITIEKNSDIILKYIRILYIRL